MDEITNQDTLRLFSKKLTPPLVTLLNSEPEIQYVALRNINLIVQKRPKILEHEIKVFFCKYNDPIYVKMEKLEIVIRLASINNIDQVYHFFFCRCEILLLSSLFMFYQFFNIRSSMWKMRTIDYHTPHLSIRSSPLLLLLLLLLLFFYPFFFPFFFALGVTGAQGICHWSGCGLRQKGKIVK